MEEEPFEIKQVSEREIWVVENILYLEDNILNVIMAGSADEKIATAIKDAFY